MIDQNNLFATEPCPFIVCTLKVLQKSRQGKCHILTLHTLHRRKSQCRHQYQLLLRFQAQVFDEPEIIKPRQEFIKSLREYRSRKFCYIRAGEDRKPCMMSTCQGWHYFLYFSLLQVQGCATNSRLSLVLLIGQEKLNLLYKC